MRESRALLLYPLTCALAGCLQLPALDFNLRSTWRTQPERNGRAVELIAGVHLGWSGGSRVLAPIDAPADFDPDDAPRPAWTADVTPCIDRELCRWELDERTAALERAGARAETESP